MAAAARTLYPHDPYMSAGEPGTSAAASTVAVTGGSGFVGRGIVAALRRQGSGVRALARRADPGLEADADIVAGSLESEPALAALAENCTALIHCAGAVRAPDAAAFDRINADATETLGRICAARGIRLVLISSLAAREAGLSPYAASKRRAEERLAAIPGLDWAALRPPLVYGPGDRATLPLFRLMRRGWLPVPATGGRFSAVYRDDLADAAVALAASPAAGVFEVADGEGPGYAWSDMAAAAATALGRSVRTLPIPRAAMTTLAALNERAARIGERAPMLYSGKVRELYHIDWVCSADPLRNATGWRPRVTLVDGVSQTFRWYTDSGWL